MPASTLSRRRSLQRRGDPAYEESLQLPHRLQLRPQALGELPQGYFVLSGEEDLFREQPARQCVEADSGLPCRRLGAGALEGVLAVGLGFPGAGHVLVPLVCKDYIEQMVLRGIPLPSSEMTRAR